MVWWRSRYLLLFGWGVIWFLPAFERTSRVLNDWLPFEVGARTLVHYQNMKVWSTPALHLYVDNPQLQIGPPPLLALALFQHLSPYVVALGFGLVMCALGIVSLAALEACAKALTEPRHHVRLHVVSFTAGVAVVAVWCHQMGVWRHLDDAMGLLCICAGMWLCARRRPWWLIAVVVGTGVSIKPWAVVAAPLILGLPRRQWGKAALLAMAVAAAWWSPFVVAAPGTVQSLASYHIFPDPGSVLALVGLHGDMSGWLRPVQFAIGVAVASYVGILGRWTAAPLAGLAIRVGLDPYVYSYYGLGPLLAAIAADLTSDSKLPRWTLFTILVEFCVPMSGSPTTEAIARLAWGAVIVGWFTRPRASWQMDETARVGCAQNHGWMELRIPHLLPQVAVFGCRSKLCHRAEGQEKSTPAARWGRKARGLEGPRVRPAASAGASQGGPRSGKLATPACYLSEGSE